MYLLDELAREYQKVLLKDAELARKFRDTASGISAEHSWRVKVGDFLINSGLKLKNNHPKNKNKGASLPIS